MTLLPGLRVQHASSPDRVVTSVHIDPLLPVFAGHYPGFPIVPGVYTLDAVHHSVLAHAGRSGITPRLERIKSARFTTPLFPGDELQVDCKVTVVGNRRTASAKCVSARGPVASVRLQYTDLQHADLQHTDLQYTDLQHAALQHAAQQHADLQHADAS